MSKEKATHKKSTHLPLLLRILLNLIFLGCVAASLGAITLGVITYRLWPQLPDLSAVTDYKPQIPLRIYSADGVLISEFGTEHRQVLDTHEVPISIKQAILAAEDDRFYEHNGISWYGVARAVIKDLQHGQKTQGASTITMQVARNFYLSKEKSYIRKLYELLLTYKIEKELSKDEILNLYMNQIFLGHRSYGFAAAAKTYFGIPLQNISIAQAAMLAGIPKGPSIYNPKSNMKRAKERQEYILGRMYKLQYITQDEYQAAMNEKIVLKSYHDQDEKNIQLENEGVSELVRQLIYNTYQDNTYNRGLNVYTTIYVKDQSYAYNALRDGVMSFNERKGYPGPAHTVQLPDNIENDPTEWEKLFEDTLSQYPDSGHLYMAIVLNASPQKVTLKTLDKTYTIQGAGLNFVKNALRKNTKKGIKRGSIVYIYKKTNSKNSYWSITNKPNVEAAFIAINPQTGAIEAIVGGFDPKQSFNRAIQAWRQPGSTFKPFIYAAGIERGLTPQTLISDQPFMLTAEQTGDHKEWKPKNYGDKYEPFLTLRDGLYRSKNMISIRILESIGQPFAYQFIERFGFDPKKQPPAGAYLTMALGSGSVTPLQMATAYCAFANGGFRITPYLIDHVTDSNGNVIMQSKPTFVNEGAPRILDPRVAWISNNLLHGVATSGTAARTESTFKRGDIGAKTGTTNNSVDAWFVGFTPNVVGVSWVGYDTPKTLGKGETGSRAALPIWMNYMSKVFKEKPITVPPTMPNNIIAENDNFYLSEYPPGIAIDKLGISNQDLEYWINNQPTTEDHEDPLKRLFD